MYARHGAPGAEQPCSGSRGGREYGGVFEEQAGWSARLGRRVRGTGQRTLVGEFFMLCPVLIYLHPTMFQGALKAVQNPAGTGWAREG